MRLQALAAELERARDASDDAAMIKACMDLVGLRGGRVRPPRREVDPASLPALRTAIERLTRRPGRGSAHASGTTAGLRRER